MLGVWTEYFLEGTEFWPGALSTLDFGILTSLRAPIKISFWDQWETAILGQILAWSVLELDFGIWAVSTWLFSC